MHNKCVLQDCFFDKCSDYIIVLLKNIPFKSNWKHCKSDMRGVSHMWMTIVYWMLIRIHFCRYVYVFLKFKVTTSRSLMFRRMKVGRHNQTPWGTCELIVYGRKERKYERRKEWYIDDGTVWRETSNSEMRNE